MKILYVEVDMINGTFKAGRGFDLTAEEIISAGFEKAVKVASAF